MVKRHHAEIYQYVGDEVVVSWDIESGTKRGNCLMIFYAYDDTIRSRAAYYQSLYGVIPVFKAGLNAGRVTAVEVGEIKKELAYYGDVLNTAARVQAKRNELDRRVLVTGQVKKRLEGHAGFRVWIHGPRFVARESRVRRSV